MTSSSPSTLTVGPTTKRAARAGLMVATLAALTPNAHADADSSRVVADSAEFVVEMRETTYNRSPPGAKDVCMKAVGAIKASGVKVIRYPIGGGSVLQVGGVKAGDGIEITFENAEKMCVLYERFWTRSKNGAELVAIEAFLDSDLKDSTEAATHTLAGADRCVKLVDEMLAAGVPDTFPMTMIAKRAKTLADVKPNVCEVQRAKAQAMLKQLEDEEGPLRKVLKEDKLDLVLANKQTQFFGVGMKPLTTPAQLAASKLWFRHSWSEEQTCRNTGAAVHTVRRSQFNAKHVLVSDTAKEFCGSPPKSAFR